MTEQPQPIQTQPSQSPPAKKSNTLALISMIAGIISLVALLINFCIPCLSLPALLFGIAGAVMGFIARKQIDESDGEQTGRKMAVSGMITGIIGAGVSLVMLLITFFMGLLGIGAGLLDTIFSFFLSGII